MPKEKMSLEDAVTIVDNLVDRAGSHETNSAWRIVQAALSKSDRSIPEHVVGAVLSELFGRKAATCCLDAMERVQQLIKSEVSTISTSKA